MKQKRKKGLMCIMAIPQMMTLQKEAKRQRKLISLDKPSLQIKQKNRDLFQILKLSKESGLKQTVFSDSYSESESYLTRDDLIKLISEKEELFILKQKEIEKIQDKFRRTYAEMGTLEKFDIQV
jgi:hypothetical protein